MLGLKPNEIANPFGQVWKELRNPWNKSVCRVQLCRTIIKNHNLFQLLNLPTFPVNSLQSAEFQFCVYLFWRTVKGLSFPSNFAGGCVSFLPFSNWVLFLLLGNPERIGLKQSSCRTTSQQQQTSFCSTVKCATWPLQLGWWTTTSHDTDDRDQDHDDDRDNGDHDHFGKFSSASPFMDMSHWARGLPNILHQVTHSQKRSRISFRSFPLDTLHIILLLLLFS